MKLKSALFFIAGVLALSGCGSKDSASKQESNTVVATNEKPTGASPDEVKNPGAPDTSKSSVSKKPEGEGKESDKPSDPSKVVAPPVSDFDKANANMLGLTPYSKVVKSKATEWTNTSGDLVAIADKMDAMLASLRSVTGDATMRYKSPKGHGSGNFKLSILDKRQFELRLPGFQDGEPRSIVLRSDGKRIGQLASGKWQFKGYGVPPKSGSDQDLIEGWISQGPISAFSGFVGGFDNYRSFVAALNRSSADYKVNIQARFVDFKGESHPYTRIFVQRVGKAAKKFGRGELEITFDPKLFLPLTIISGSQDPKGNKTEMYFTTVWQNHQTFNKSVFELPAS